jgi:3-keto-5-aminohexanoate cleavage enzyme
MVDYAAYLYKRGLLQGPCYVNLILGSLGSISASPRNLVRMTEDLHPDLVWSATGIGKRAFPMQCLFIALGGGVRVGLEDCLYMDDGRTRPATNVELVQRVKNVAEAMGREIATPGEVRQLLGIPSP